MESNEFEWVDNRMGYIPDYLLKNWICIWNEFNIMDKSKVFKSDGMLIFSDESVYNNNNLDQSKLV